MFSIIKTCEKKSFGFKNINDVNEYRFRTKTDQSDLFAESICNHFKVISDDMIFYYNTDTKLWKEIKKSDFKSFVFGFYNNSAKEIKKILKDQDQIDGEVEKKIKELIGSFDNKTFIDDIFTRSFSLLTNTQFITFLNGAKEFLPIKDGKKINLRTLEITERSSSDYFTYESPVEYLEKTPNADKFFSQIQPKKDNRELVRKVLGYSLTGDTKARKFFVWYGHGSNGKSKVFQIMEKILNCQYTQLHPSIFMKTGGKKSGGAASPEIMDLMGKRAGVHSEGETADDAEMNIGGIKGITGEDKIQGRPLYCPKVDFYPYVKIHLLTNYTPPLDAQKATKDRLLYIFMDTNFTHNPKHKNDVMIDNDFADKIENEYLSGMFSWIVKGSKEYFKDRKIEMTDEFQNRTDSVLSSQDSIASFFARAIKKCKTNDSFVKRSDLFSEYMRFCTANSLRCQRRSSLFNRIEQFGAIGATLHGYDGFRNIELVDYTDEEPVQQINYFNQGVSSEDKSIDAIAEFKQIIEQNKAEIERLQQIEIMYKQLLEEKQNENKQSKLEIVKSMTLSKPKPKQQEQEQTKPKPKQKEQTKPKTVTKPQSYRTFDVEDFIQNSIDDSMKDHNDIFNF